jgi:acetyl esterase/lipase
MHKPSTLWPPPSDEMTSHVRSSLRSRIRQTLRMDDHDHHSGQNIPIPVKVNSAEDKAGMPIDVGATAELPSIDPTHKNPTHSETILLTAKSGEELRIDKQVQLYAQNSQLTHPLISSVLSYLGGLPPLLFIASEKEVLRDEIIYT